jgi:hypothetical protein
MQPCPACLRHVRNDELECPFCGVDLRFSKVFATPTLGAFAFAAMATLGTAACSKDVPSGSDGATTTSSSSTTIDDTSESGMVDTETSTDDGPDDTTLSTGSFYAGPEIDISLSACDPWLQDCPEGEKCVPYGSTGGNWNANKCVPVTGSGAAGDPCVYGGTVEATDDCGAGLYCWNVVDVEGLPTGTCTPFCQGSPDEPQCEPGTSCLIAYDGSVNLCIATCDPVMQNCDPGLACYWTSENFHCVFTTSDLPIGDACGFINDCVAGAACLDAALVPDCGGMGCCASFCDLDSLEPCPQPGTECSSFFEEGMAPPEYANVGVCVLPSP